MRIIYGVLDLPAAPIFGVLLLLYGSYALLLFWLSFHSPLRSRIASMSGVVAPYFNAIAILFALLTGFLAGDVGERNRTAHRALLAEAEGLTTLHTLSIAAVSEMSAIRAAARDYVRAVIDDEWARMGRREHSAKTETALGILLRTVADPKITGESGQPVHAGLLNTVLRIRIARNDRLALSADRSNEVKWLIVLVLGLLTQTAIALVHIERPRAQGAALALFSLAVVITLGLLAMQENPYSGAVRFSSAPLAHALEIMERPSDPGVCGSFGESNDGRCLSQ